METLTTNSKKEVILQAGISSEGNQVFNVKPVIKLTLDGILLFANNTGIDFLEMLADYVKAPALNYLLKECPEILDPHCSIDLCCQIYDMKYYFSIVAFKEAGYVGLYGYRLVHTKAA